ncbi:block of proliferation 1 [Monosiga brevicollis MX1]|uniref:Ribosome biogenesis protein BOP1 homolog n=1 Tax=Monosiga brevicollis TaxID=81824 RepID=BOP1_MONBE|nr:block of proliferation 1 [Monosiga brevicollis MX1]A9UZS7.1 RecName: Full=Ribosome biogenesis protein BOP1 homolog [Monosiga brevicollis]EDQ89285.1 block of proliferation 1 [Monosiga brevicollis MX1]|eukprot:XP_001745861.1 block of proliferation 1 [Monosiga brevicollis MX1]
MPRRVRAQKRTAGVVEDEEVKAEQVRREHKAKQKQAVGSDAEQEEEELFPDSLHGPDSESDVTDDEQIDEEARQADRDLLKELVTLQGLNGEDPSDADNDDDDDEEEAASDDDDEEEDAEPSSDSSNEASDAGQEEGTTDPHTTTDDKASATTQMVVYSSDDDTSDEEHSLNRVGRIPMEWYEDYEHIGYDLNGKRIRKPKQKDRLEKFLDAFEAGNNGRTIYDPVTGKEIELTDDDINMIKRIQSGQLPDTGINPYEDYVDFFTHEKMQTPVVDKPEPKRRFVPSKWEHKKIMKIVRSIRKGLIKLPTSDDEKDKSSEEEQYYDVWGNEDDPNDPRIKVRQANHIAAPKVALPHHAESYNPPEEYLPTDAEAEKWRNAHEDDRERNYLPHKYGSLRLVPAYDQYIQERFHRCLDLYLCPRARRIRMNVDPEDLLPKLPKPEDLQPFPSAPSLVYRGHKARVTSISCDPTGQWLVSGSDDKTIRVWEISTGRCVRVVTVDAEVNMVAWCPNAGVSIVAVAHGHTVSLICPRVATAAIDKATAVLCNQSIEKPSQGAEEGMRATPTWNRIRGERQDQDGIFFEIPHHAEVMQVTWHHKGNYFASVMPRAETQSVCVHSLNRQSTQHPFQKRNRDVQRVLFHPTQPLFFVATKTHVRVYNLQAQALVKKLLTGVRWLSSLAIHPAGDNLIIGSYDKRLCWFDMDLSIKPYKILRYHKYALRQVCFHKKYPIFASCGDDGNVHVLHGMVYNDLGQNPLIVPVKIIKAHNQTSDGMGVMDCTFHPSQPWLFSAGSDGSIKLHV